MTVPPTGSVPTDATTAPTTAPPDTPLIPTAPPLTDLPREVIGEPACASDVGSWCARFWQWTDSDLLARSADQIVDHTLTISVILLVALLARYLLHRGIHRVIEGATSGRISRLVNRRTRPRLTEGAPPTTSPRRAQRARTIGSVLRSASSAVVGTVAVVMVLAEFGVALGPILASAGIVGVALGFGAQNLVRDFLSGMFILLEDQYGVGDIVDLGSASGTVEAVGLRITTVRDGNGTVWYVRNGEILRVGNKTQGYAVAVADIPLALGADVAQAAEVAGRVAADVVASPGVADHVIGEPEVVGIEKITTDGVVFRVTVRTAPGQQFRVQRELITALARAFDEDGVPRTGAPAAPAGPAGGG